MTWLRYYGHRANSTKRPGQADAAYWLASVVVSESKRERMLAGERADRRRSGPPAPAERPEPTQAERDRQRAELTRRVAKYRPDAPSSADVDPGARFAGDGDAGSPPGGAGPSGGILGRSLRGAR